MVSGSLARTSNGKFRNADRDDQRSRESKLNQEIRENGKVGCDCDNRYEGDATKARPQQTRIKHPGANEGDT